MAVLKGKALLGRQRLRAVLKELPVAARQELQQAMNESGEKLADRQRSLVPVKEGTLRASIRVEPFNRGGIGVIVKAGGPTTMKPVRNTSKAPLYDYAMAQELGTQDMLAQPFFFPAYRHTKSSVKRRATVAVKRAVAKAVK